MARTSRATTEQERARRREEKRQQAEAALDELLTQEGWATWLRLRRHLHEYSWTNQVLIAMQAHAQAALAEADDPDAPNTPCSAAPTIVKSAGRWKRDGYHPAKGTRALLVWVFKSRRRQDGAWLCCGRVLDEGHRRCACGKEDHYFQLGPTFDASQIRAFENGEPPVIELPQGEPIDGEHPGHLLIEPLALHAAAEGWVASVDLDADSDHGELGSFNQRTHELRVVASGSANARLRVLIHELAHARGITSRKTVESQHGDDPSQEDLHLTYAEAEVAVECVSFIVASSAGLDTRGEAIPYIAGWGGEDAKHKIRRLAALIDKTAKELEGPILELLAHQATADEIADEGCTAIADEKSALPA
jgi:hypothetical protein